MREYETGWLVCSCAACGTKNIVRKESTDGSTCAYCGDGPMIPLGYAILQGTIKRTMKLEVEMDKTDVEKALKEIEERIDRINSKAERIQALLKEGGQQNDSTDGN